MYGWHQIPDDLLKVESCNPFNNRQQDGIHSAKLSWGIERIAGLLLKRIVFGLASLSLFDWLGSIDLRLLEFLSRRNHFYRPNHIDSGALDDKLVIAL